MDRITVRASVSQQAALARGSSLYGHASVALSDADIAGLSAGARAELLLEAIGPLDIAEATPAAVCAALEVEAAKRASAKVAREAKREKEIADAIARPLDDWIVRNLDGAPFISTGPQNMYLASDQCDDPRVIARRAEIKAEFAPILSAYYAGCAAKRAEREAACAAAKRAKDACAAAMRARAASRDDLSRAAREGYPVERAVLDALTDDLRASVAVAADCDTSTNLYDLDALEVRPAPSEDAFALLDAAATAIASANAALPAEIGQWIASKIVRLDVGSRDHHHWVTAVIAQLHTPVGDREITWSTESMAPPPGEDD